MASHDTGSVPTGNHTHTSGTLPPDVRRSSRRRFLRTSGVMVAGAGVSLLGLAACGPGAPPAGQTGQGQAPQGQPAQSQAAPAAKGGSPVELRFYSFQNIDDLPTWKAGIDAFHQQHPNIQIKMESAPFANYWEKLQTMVAGNAVPDVMLMVTMYVNQYAKLGAIRGLRPFIEADKDVNYEDRWKAVEQVNQVDDKGPYQLHYDLSTYLVYYNKALFQAKGIKDPNDNADGWTFDQFVEAAVACTGDGPQGKTWGFMTPAGLPSASSIDGWLKAGGGSLLSPDNKTCLLNSPENVATYTMLTELWTKHKAAPGKAEMGDIPLFESGRVGMNYTNPERSLQYRARITDFEWDVARLPTKQAGLKVNTVQGGGLSIGATTKYPDEAWTFLKFYTSASNLAEMIGKSARGIPGRPSVANSLLRPDQPPKHMQLFLEAVEYSSCPYVGNYAELEKTMVTMHDQLMLGQKGVKEALDATAPQIQALL
jgi:multiple sugar transport system substrate-binding protein